MAERLSRSARTHLRQLTVLWPALTMHLAFGVTFLCLAVLFAAAAGVIGGLTWLLVWPAVSLVIVGAGYVWLGARVTGKRADGTFAWHVALPVVPYLGVAQMAWYAVRVLGDEDVYNEISQGLFLGRRVQHWEMPARVGLVIDMTAEFIEPPEVRRGRAYLCLPTLDGGVPQPHALADLVQQALRVPGNVFVHCAAGHGRSAMALAVLMVARGLVRDVDAAIEQMNRVRPRVRLRTSQRRVALQACALLAQDGVLPRDL